MKKVIIIVLSILIAGAAATAGALALTHKSPEEKITAFFEAATHSDTKTMKKMCDYPDYEISSIQTTMKDNSVKEVTVETAEAVGEKSGYSFLAVYYTVKYKEDSSMPCFEFFVIKNGKFRSAGSIESDIVDYFDKQASAYFNTAQYIKRQKEIISALANNADKWVNEATDSSDNGFAAVQDELLRQAQQAAEDAARDSASQAQQAAEDAARDSASQAQQAAEDAARDSARQAQQAAEDAARAAQQAAHQVLMTSMSFQ